METVKKIFAVVLVFAVVFPLVFTGCSSENSDDVVQTSGLSDAEREEFIQTKIIGDGKVLLEEDMTLVNDVDGYANGTTDMAQVLSNYDFDLFIDFSTTAIALVDNRGSEPITYHSDTSRSGDGSVGQTLTLEAYDNTNKKYEFNTTDNCISDPTYYQIVQLDESTIRIVYTIGNDPDKELNPPVLTVESYDSIVAALQAKYEETGDEEFSYMQDDLDNLYKRLDPESLSMEDKEKLQTTYPTVTIRPLYVLRNLTQKQKKLVRNAMEAAGFTVEDLKAEMEVVEYSGAARAVMFTVPVDITLTESGIKVSVDSSLILSPAAQKLYKIGLYPQFGAIKTTKTSDVEEYIILPDGSGAVMAIAGNLTPDTYRARIYGDDMTFQQELQTEKSEQALSSFFIFERGERGSFTAVMESGAAQTFLRASPMGKSTRVESEYASVNYELVYAERDFRSYTSETDEETEDTTVTTVGSGVITSKEQATTVFTVNYLFNKYEFGEDIKTYSDHAKIYRDYLIDSGKLLDQKVVNTVTPFYLELLGAVDKDVSVAGIPVEKKQSLTSYSEATEIVQKLYDAGVKGESLVLRYTAWANGGYYNTAADDLKLMSEMGSESELKSLSELLSSNGSGFYPSVDFLYVYRDSSFGTFNYQTDAARRIDNRVARVNLRNPATGLLSTEEKTNKTVVSSQVFSQFASSYKSSYERILPTYQISLMGVGQDLNSNYRTGNIINREKSLENTIGLLDVFSQYSLMVDKGNDYTWKYADYIIDLPDGSSELLSTVRAIPFMQIVLHGYVNYVGSSFNVESDYSSSILKAVETGSGVYFKWIAQSNDIFQNTGLSDFYSLNYNDTFDEAIECYKKVSSVVDLVVSSPIDRHEQTEAYVVSSYIGELRPLLPGEPGYVPGANNMTFDRTPANNVYTTVFENGVEVVVNYNSYDIELDDTARTQVKANSFIYREGETGEWTE